MSECESTRVNRRRLLAGVGTWVATSVAGCSATDGSNETTTRDTASESTPTTTATTSTPTPYERRLEAFRSYITERGVVVERLATTDEGDNVSLRYVTKKSEYQELGGEVGMIAGGFFQQVGNGWDVQRLDAVVLKDEDTPFGRWHADVTWYEQFRNGELTADQLSLKVLQTLERA
jgi:hypothetical protein